MHELAISAAPTNPAAPTNRAAPTSPPDQQRVWLVYLAYLLVALAALLPRVLDLGRFLDSDEINFWLPRSYEFLRALHDGNLAGTAVSTHPGITTVWLGSLSISVRRLFIDWGLLDQLPFPVFLATMRLPVALVNAGCVVLGYALLRRMLPASIALLGALFWALDPFIVAYSRIVHVDALMMSFATLCLLAAACYWHHQQRSWLLVLSGACGALAVLSKSPGLAVLPVILLGFGLWALGERATRRARLWPLLLWGAAFGLTALVVFPALWAAPLDVYRLLRIGVEQEGSTPHVIANFFLGRANDAPGPLFYPVALALRSTPWLLLGLLLLPWAWPRGGAQLAARRDLLLLVGFVLLFVLAMSFFPKKLNRYSLPVFPALNIVAAAGLVWGIERLARGRRRMVAAAVGALALAAVLNVAWWHPYGVVAFNQALGGAPMGTRTFLMGDGEGLHQVADWLNQQPDITGVTVASTMGRSLQPYLRHGAQRVQPEDGRLPADAGYLVVYLRDVQRGVPLPPLDEYYPAQTPIYTATIHSVPYAWIYQVAPPLANPLAAQFGAGLHLRGYALDSSELRSAGRLLLTLQWQAQATPAHDYLVFAHVLDETGQRVGQADFAPAGPQQPTSTWQPQRVYTWQNPLPVPADLPAGDYWLALGLYDPQSMARLPLHTATETAEPPAGVDRVDDGSTLLLPLRLP
jgi:hypothetical protein